MNIHRNGPKMNKLHQVTMKPLLLTKKGSRSTDTPKQTSNNDSTSHSICEEAPKSLSQSNSGTCSAVATTDRSLPDVDAKHTSISHGATHRCPHCSKSYMYRTGLSKHLKKHSDKPTPAGHIKCNECNSR